jgi:hypothetical protein
MDYNVSGRPDKPIFEPQSDAAKARTPEPIQFADRESAFDFMLAAQAEGFRFSGANLIDPAQKPVKNRYFLKDRDGLIPTGSDWGPRVPVWVVGDVMPIHDASGAQVGEAEIEAILDNDQVPKLFGCNIAFILKKKTA